MNKLSIALAQVEAVYEIPDDDLVGEVLIPAMSNADEVRIASGYFSSLCLAQIAPGLAALIHNGGMPIKLLISPEISPEDRTAIEEGIKTPQEVIDRVASELLCESGMMVSALVTHSRECFAFLIAKQRLEIRFVLMDEGIYHKKQWLIRADDTWVAVHGSGNATSRGLLVNGEQMTVDRAWNDGDIAELRVRKLIGQWERQWNNKHPRSLTLSVSEGLRFAGRGPRQSKVPTVDDFWEAWQRDHSVGIEPELPQRARHAARKLLQVPNDLVWRTGQYRHQGVAVDAFFASAGRGVLAIATGGGKTRTALIASAEAQNRHKGPTLVIVLVPSRPLLLQWADDVRKFGIEPVLPSVGSQTDRQRRLQEVEVALGVNSQRTEVMVVTNSLFARDDNIRDMVARLPSHIQVVLIGDEMHNLGARTVFNCLPERADSRLGLSATPVRQYDPDGSDRLFAYFGPPVFEFGLGDAINAGCLTPYEYYLHEVPMSDQEIDKWIEFTEELRKAGFKIDDDGQSVVPTAKAERLLRKRRAVLEQAEAKIEVLRELLQMIGPTRVQRCLIYTSAKGQVFGYRRQIEQVNEMLSALGIVSHQFTSAETAYRDADHWLESFGRGDYQVLTAMKVLDEGIDIPQTDTAFLLASSAVQREWVQRRGRILRKYPGKTYARLHDFLVVPPDRESAEGLSILKSELRRAGEFARDAENEWDDGGPRAIISGFEDFT